MINDGPKNEIYLEPGQTLAVRLTASDYGKVAVGMRSLNGGTVNYRLNGTDGSVSSSVDLYYETKPQNGMLVITNTGSSVMALTKIRVTGLASGTSLASSFSVDADTVVYALQCIAGETEEEMLPFTDIYKKHGNEVRTDHISIEVNGTPLKTTFRILNGLTVYRYILRDAPGGAPRGPVSGKSTN